MKSRFGEASNSKPFKLDIIGVRETVANLTSLIENFSGDNHEKQRIESTLCHINGRVHRLLAREPNEFMEKKMLSMEVLKLEGNFELKLKSLGASREMHVFIPIGDRSNSDNLPNIVTNCMWFRSVPVCKWNL